MNFKKKQWLIFIPLFLITLFSIYYIKTQKITPSKSNIIYEVEDINDDGSSLKYIVGKNDSLVKIDNNLRFWIRSSLSDNTAIVYNSNEGRYGYINDKINLLFDFPSSNSIELGSFNEGVAWISEEFSPLRLINKKNETLFQCNFCTETKIFSEGLSGFKNKNGRWGYMDIKGNVKFILPPNVRFIGDFHEGLAKVYFDFKQNNAVLDQEIIELDKFGYINNLGEIVIPPKFYDEFDNDYIDNSFSDGYAVIETREGFQGVIDKKGGFFLLPKYKTVINTPKGFIINSNPNQYHFIEKPKNIFEKIIEIVSADESKILIPQKKNNKFGYVNQHGEYVIQPQYSNAKFFENGRAIVEINKIENLINEKGEILLNTKVKERLLNISSSNVNHLKSQQLSVGKIKNYFSKLNFNDDLQKLSLLFKNSELITSNDWAININSLEFLTDNYTFSIGALCINNFYLTDFDNFQFNPQYSNSNSYVPKMFLIRFTSNHAPSGDGNNEKFRLNKMIELKNHLISDLKLVHFSIDNSFINKSELYLLKDFDNKIIIMKSIEDDHFDALYLELDNLKQYIKNKRMSQLFSN